MRRSKQILQNTMQPALSSLHRRLLTLGLTILGCFAIAGGFILWSLIGMQNSLATTTDQTVHDLIPVFHLEGEIRKAELLGWETAFAIDGGAPAFVRGSFDTQTRNVTTTLETYETDLGAHYEIHAVEMAAAVRHWNTALEGYETAFGGSHADQFVLATELGTVSDEIDALVLQLDKVQTAALQEQADVTSEAAHQKNVALWVAIAVLVAGFLVTYSMARFLFGGVVGVLNNLRDGARRLANGDWGHQVEAAGPTELVELGESFNTMSERLDQSHTELAYRAFHDQLTGLSNRELIADCIDAAATTRHIRGRIDAFLVVDLDRFKDLNDTRGHSLGDEALVVVAQRITDCVRVHDSVARLGGDEFGILLEGISSMAEAEVVAERLVQTLSEPIRLDATAAVVTASVGIADAAGATTSTELISAADLAMYEAKRAGGSTWRMFEAGLREALEERVKLESDLRTAIAGDEIDVVYQAIFDLESDQPVGVEALARWTHPTLGPISPARFIPIAENAGMVADLGWNVLRRACTQVATWRANYAGLEQFTVAVNVAGPHIEEENFVERVLRTADIAGLEPENLALEITETMMLQRGPVVGDNLQRLLDHGVSIAIDDFGTGYSSLSALRDYPVDTLKIDRDFISAIDSVSHKQSLTRTIVDLAQNLQMRCIAEGIETGEELDAVRSTGCRFAQGYFFHRPSPALDTEALLALGSSAAPTG